MARVTRLDPSSEWSDLTLILTDDKGIVAFNRRVFCRNHITDVISLRYEPDPKEDGGHTAEVIVNVQRACNEGMRRSSHPGTWGPNKELALYMAHGCDHLSGEDDTGNVLRTRMRRRELRWIKEAESAGLLNKLIEV